MKKYFKYAVNVLNENIIFVCILAFTGICILSGAMYILAIFNVVASLIIFPIVYGRITEKIKGAQHEPFIEIFRKHRFNYYSVFIILAIPLFIFLFFFKDLMPFITGMIVKHALAAIINTLTIYVFPLIFLNRVRFTAIPSGIKFLFRNFKNSVSLIWLALIIQIIAVFVSLSHAIFIPYRNLAILSLIGFVQSFLTAYIHLIVFIIACRILIDKGVVNTDLNGPAPLNKEAA